MTETPTPHGGKRRSRWDETPASQRIGSVSTPQMGTTPIIGATPNFSALTPAGALAMGLQTPSSGKSVFIVCNVCVSIVNALVLVSIYACTCACTCTYSSTCTFYNK